MSRIIVCVRAAKARWANLVSRKLNPSSCVCICACALEDRMEAKERVANNMPARMFCRRMRTDCRRRQTREDRRNPGKEPTREHSKWRKTALRSIATSCVPPDIDPLDFCACPNPRALVVTKIPTQSTTVVAGLQYIDGVPVGNEAGEAAEFGARGVAGLRLACKVKKNQ